VNGRQNSSKERGIKMKVTVNKDKCQGCGVCEADVPEVFAMGDDNHATVLVDEIPTNLEDAVKQAVDDCPESAIEIA
jgi:ferredoxin